MENRVRGRGEGRSEWGGVKLGAAEPRWGEVGLYMINFLGLRMKGIPTLGLCLTEMHVTD